MVQYTSIYGKKKKTFIILKPCLYSVTIIYYKKIKFLTGYEIAVQILVTKDILEKFSFKKKNC